MNIQFPNHRFNALVNYQGSLVPHSLTSSQYADYDEMKQDFERTGRIKVNVDYSTGTIFCSPTTNWNFRAWHDMCHILEDAPFSREGEYMAMIRMQEQVYDMPDLTAEEKKLFALLIECEVMGQVDYYEQHGGFPTNQLEFAKNWLSQVESFVSI